MHIKKISLKNYRNITDSSLIFEDGVNVLLGNNAQGKTNIIEALWLFSACKTFRVGNEKNFIKFGENKSEITAHFNKNGRQFEGVMRFYTDRKRDMFLNNISVKPNEIIGNFTSVLFFPEHLNLIKDGPDGRRKFIDFAICQVKPRYYGLLSEYNRILIQRNSVLRSKRLDINETLNIWDLKISKIGALIAITRESYIKKLTEYAKNVIHEISVGKENLEIAYKSCVKLDERENIEGYIFEVLSRCRENDQRFGYTTVGVHRDDFDIIINNKNARLFSSQGQQRSCVMALKLAEAEILNSEYGEYPIMLFDDVFSELDSGRKQYIIEKIKNKQVILTSCEKLEDFAGAKIFNIKNGEVVP